MKIISAVAILLALCVCVAHAAWHKLSTHHDCGDISTCNGVGTHEVTCERWGYWGCRGLFSHSCKFRDYENRHARCSCRPGFAGQQCNVCADGHGVFPHCTAETTAAIQGRAEEKKRGELADAIAKVASDNGLTGYERSKLVKETSTALRVQLDALNAKVAADKKHVQLAKEIVKVAQASDLSGYKLNVLLKQSTTELTDTLGALRDYAKTDHAAPTKYYQPAHTPQVNIHH